MRRHESIQDYICIYCGRPGHSTDHVPPRIVSNEGMIVRSCKECNDALGSRRLMTIPERIEYLLALDLQRKSARHIGPVERQHMKKQLARLVASGPSPRK